MFQLSTNSSVVTHDESLERIPDHDLREIVKISQSQCGFIRGYGTTNAIHVTRLLLEKYYEKKKPIHLVFIDLKKVFDRVSREVIWYALRWHGIPEELINYMKLPQRPTKQNDFNSRNIEAVLHFGPWLPKISSLVPFVILVMDSITRGLQEFTPQTLLYKHDFIVALEDKKS